MIATEARKRRGGSTLLERTKADPARSRRIDQLVATASIEQLFEAVMDQEHVSAAELARRMKAKPPQISRDLHGGLSNATVRRVSALANALGYDFMPVLVPRVHDSKRKRFLEAYRALFPDHPTDTACPRHEPKSMKTPKRKSKQPATKRKVA